MKRKIAAVIKLESKQGLRIYNLFPRLAGTITEWIEYLDDIKYMEFNTVYINPIFETGYSKNMYAPKDFYKIDNIFLDEDSNLEPIEQFREFVKEAHKRDIKVILEVIMTHTSMDCELVMTNPDWYKYNNGKIQRFLMREGENWIQWGDLLEVDNEMSPDKENLRKYWKGILRYYIEETNIDGIKCEAAHKITPEFWKEIINFTRELKKDFLFIADNFGAEFNEARELAKVDFDYIYTSLKWWDLSSAWFIEQHYNLKDLICMISFPESHDTERVSFKYEKNISASEAWYSICAFFNTGVMIPIGYEYGFELKLDIVNSFKDDMEEKKMDIKDYIRKINSIKKEYPLFNEETDIYLLNSNNFYVFIFKKVSRDKEEEALIVVNMDFKANQEIYINNLRGIITKNKIEDISPEDRINYIPNNFHYKLRPGEVRIFYGRD